MKISRILCAVDNDPLASSVFDWGFGLAQRIGAEVALVSIYNLNEIQSGESGIDVNTARALLGKEVQQLFKRLLAEKGDPNVFRFSEEGNPRDSILKVAREWKADLIVIASHARTGLARMLEGSVAESVLRNSHCPVLIIPSKA